MKTARERWVLLGLAGAAGLFLAWAATRTRPEAAPARTQRTAAEASATRPEASEIERRVAPAADSAPVPASAASFARPGTYAGRGRVRDAAGEGVADVGIGTLSDRERGSAAARSGPDGSFAIAVADDPATVVAVDAHWVTVRSGAVWVRPPSTLRSSSWRR